MGYYSAMTTWMDLKGIMLSETSKTEDDKYCMMSLIRRILKRQVNNEANGFRVVVDRGRGWEMGEMGEGKSEGK